MVSNGLGATGDRLDAFIGVDVGGTHTDVTAVLDARVARGKALTTYDDFSRGLLEATAVAAGNLDVSLEELLGRTRLFMNATTVVTNSITELRGSPVGVLLTTGFRDAFRFAGGPRLNELDDHLQRNVPDLVARDALMEIDERIDYSGAELLPLDEGGVREAVRHLVDEIGVESIAICFLSSYINPAHELAAERIVSELYPDVFVTTSHRVFPVVGETRRWTTAVLNSFVQRRAELYLDSVSEKLADAGLGGRLAFFQGLGGAISVGKAKAFPLALLGSGPAGGAIGANELAERMGYKRVLLADMGGTSFDTGIIDGNEIPIVHDLKLGRFQTGVNLVDVMSVGAGGGSIAWVDERGVPQVGPHSAGSTPGPAVYDRGGTEPTVTDAMVALGFIDPERYLAGRVALKPELAEQALQRVLGDRFGWSVDESAAAVHDLVVVNMANAVREVTVAKGHDPREFAFLTYGGTLPLFCMQIADRLGIKTVIIPHNSSVFCALGLLSSDYVMRFDQTVGWNLSDEDGYAHVNEVADRLVETARAEMRAEFFEDEDVSVSRSAYLRFQGQSSELGLPLPDAPLTAEDGAALAERFFELYERTYGAGTGWRDVPVVMLKYSVTVVGRRDRPRLGDATPEPRGADEIRTATRSLYLPDVKRREEVPIYDDARFTAGTRLDGPAIIDASDTTIYVPDGTSVERDVYMNYLLTRE